MKQLIKLSFLAVIITTTTVSYTITDSQKTQKTSKKSISEQKCNKIIKSKKIANLKIDSHIEESALTKWTQELGISILLTLLELKDYIKYQKKIALCWLRKLSEKIPL